MGMWEQVTGDAAQQPKPRSLRSQPPARTSRTEWKQAQRSESAAPASSTQPTEVLPEIWSAAQYWVQQGEVAYGSRPPVNLGEFAKRLQTSVESSRELSQALAEHEDRNPAEVGAAYVEDLLQVMIENFWNVREAGETLTASLQWRFLRDEWPTLEDRARTTLRVRRILKNPRQVTAPSITKENNPYLRAIAASTMRTYLEAGLAEDPEAPVSIRKRNLKKPSRAAV